MRLHSGASLAGLCELPGVTAEQLQSVTEAVERRKERLTQDIDDYISRKQAELHDYEQQVPTPSRPRRIGSAQVLTVGPVM